ncbi:PucR family transcriptional regulator [Saccharomonospora saliphila]|uniref:PucR family transcriptional regulator n=1 Tax=Saccharomonospora saliphila TaxID=369829 RepID=UPI0012FAFB40|nr:helix-turn-helix domain-containing protein [Saccharomonospora saliphila]
MQGEADITQKLADVATAMAGREQELTAELVALYERELPHLVHDDENMVSLLASSVRQNIDTALGLFRHGIAPDRVEAPASAIEYARRLAQRGTSVVHLVRAYYLGQTAVLDHALDEGARQIADPGDLGGSMRTALATAFAFIDRVTQQVVSAYEDERNRWSLNRSAVRAARVRAVLDDESVDVDASELALGYRLRGHHVGMIVWYPAQAHPPDPLAGLERVAHRLPGYGDREERPLFVPHDELCAWVWLPVAEATSARCLEAERALLDSDPEVRIALGDPASGLSGFRRTHRQALRVQALSRAAGERCARLLSFREVGSVALMSADLQAARTWVADTLGALADDDPQQERLRETLRVFLASGGSYTAAASRLSMHKNSVQYRVRKAEELLGGPIADNRLDVELALRLCHRLGEAVLRGATAR